MRHASEHISETISVRRGNSHISIIRIVSLTVGKNDKINDEHDNEKCYDDSKRETS